ncbi:prepilin-type N-terminal cleavage/methylation domain-containing protein [Halanaerobium hydrogeniformans]|uniref:Prepilin-type N-terminal cleavage/methylation domain-containing protein n=1 Tax=Halanaerobium hydrogeniformans TaxID=656519 RepID=E4RLF4_HALHG|nr:prepilin-type N-terminal cleavage/methylation domain-containing protein [Halanaerobium hydrogeniformans]ADQ14868.1 hypothetical protein Halsa_1441 [Halanaerobium hydrogeniformans]
MDIKKDDGFTLLEVIISITIITLILGVLFNINLAGFRFFNINQRNVELSQLVSVITANLDSKIRARDINQIELEGKITGSSNPEKFQRLIIEYDGNKYKYYHDNNNNSLAIENNGGTRYLAEENIKNVTFSIDSATALVRYTIVLENENKEFEISNKIFPRRSLEDTGN